MKNATKKKRKKATAHVRAVAVYRTNQAKGLLQRHKIAEDADERLLPCRSERLRMELHGNDGMRGAWRALVGFDDTVVCYGHESQAVSEALHALMVRRVHRYPAWVLRTLADSRILCSLAGWRWNIGHQNLSKVCGRIHHDGMRLLAGIKLMRELGASLGRKILIERSAEEDIDHLLAAADAQNRLVELHRRLEEGMVAGVAPVVHLAKLRDRLLAEISRIDVLSTGEDHAIAATDDLFQKGLIRSLRNSHRNGSHSQNGVEVARADLAETIVTCAGGYGHIAHLRERGDAYEKQCHRKYYSSSHSHFMKRAGF